MSTQTVYLTPNERGTEMATLETITKWSADYRGELI